MSVSPGRASRLLGRAREEAENAPVPERARALVAVALGGEPDDIAHAREASEGKDRLRALLVMHLIKRGLYEEALSLLGSIQGAALRGHAALALIEASRRPFSDAALEGLPPGYAAQILFLSSVLGASVEPQAILRLKDRARDELERIQVIIAGTALSTLMGRAEEARRLMEALPPWAADDLHFAVVEAHARAGRVEDARSYARSLTEDVLRMECYLRQLSYVEDRVTAVLARSLLNLSRVPRLYALKLAKKTRAAPDLERAEAYVWQDLDLSSIFDVLALLDLGELTGGVKEAEQAWDGFRHLAEDEDPAALQSARRLAALLARAKEPGAAGEFVQEISTPALRRAAAQGAIPAIAQLGDISLALALVSEIPDAEGRATALAEAAALLMAGSSPAASSSPSLGSASFAARSPESAEAKKPDVSSEETDYDSQTQTGFRVKSRGEENRDSPPSSGGVLGLPIAGEFEDDATFDGKRRRAASDLVKLLDVVPNTVAPRRATPVPELAGKQDAPSGEVPSTSSGRPRTPSEPRLASYGQREGRERSPSSPPLLSGRSSSLSGGGAVKGVSLGREVTPRSSSAPSPRLEGLLEELRRLALRLEGGAAADVRRMLWMVSEEASDLSEARAACGSRASSLMELGVALAQRDRTSEAKEIAQKIPDGEERGRVLAALARQAAQQGDLFLAESEVLATTKPLSRALILLEIAEASSTLDRLEDAERALAESPAGPTQARVATRLAVLYALARRPSRALRVGGEDVRLAVMRRLVREDRREEASWYLGGIEGQEDLLEGLLCLVSQGQEDPWLLRARALLEGIEPPRRRLSPALRLARKTCLPADINLACALAERHLNQDSSRGPHDLLLLYEVSKSEKDLDLLADLLTRRRGLSEGESPRVLRGLVGHLWKADDSGRRLLAFIEAMLDKGGRALAAEAAARWIAGAGLIDTALQAARLSPDPVFTAYGLVAVAASLAGVESPYKYPEGQGVEEE